MDLIGPDGFCREVTGTIMECDVPSSSTLLVIQATMASEHSTSLPALSMLVRSLPDSPGTSYFQIFSEPVLIDTQHQCRSSRWCLLSVSLAD
jgi:hypothetical protein